MKVSIIISTYNAVDWLRKVLLGYSVQTEQDFEIIIADDGSSHETKTLINDFQSKFRNPIIHVDEIDAAVENLKYNHIVSNMWGGSQMAANHQRRNM